MAGTTNVVERLDPRVKFIALTLLAIQSFVFTSSISLLTAAVLLIVAVILARIPLLSLWKRLVSVSVFLILIFGLNLFSVSGDVIFEFAGMYATREGFHQGAMLASRILILLVAATVFVRTTPIVAMIDGIDATLGPLRKRMGAIIQVLTIALNFVPLMIRSAQQIKNAQISRGAEPDKNVVRQFSFALSAAIPLFVMTLRSSDQLALAMDARCYDPLAERSHIGHLRMNPGDWLTLILMVAQFLISTTMAT